MGNERVEHLGNGRMLAAFCGADILSVHAPRPDSPAACSIVCSLRGALSCTCDPVKGVRYTSLTGSDTRIRLIDYTDPEKCILVRRIKAYDPITLRLSFPPEARICTRIRRSESRLVIELRDAFVSITVRGNARLISQNEINAAAGESELIVSGADPAGIAEIFDPPQSKQIAERVSAYSNARIATDAHRELYSRLCTGAGMLHSAATGECIIDEQEQALRLLLDLGMRRRARELIDFWLTLYRENGFVPYAVTPSGSVTRRGAFPALNALYPVQWIKIYHEATDDTPYVQRHLEQIVHMTASTAELVRNSHLPFCGCEERFVPGTPAQALFFGSRRSDERLIAAVDALESLAGTAEWRTRQFPALHRVRNSVAAALGDYPADDADAAWPPRAQRLRMPKMLFSHCEACAERGVQTAESACMRAPDGRYLCPFCYTLSST